MLLRRITTYTFLVVFLYSSLGYYISFLIQKHHIRKEIKQAIKLGLPQKNLVRLSFMVSSDEYKRLEWIESNEFRYKGQMYDVVRTSANDNGEILFYCINDKQEEKLFANLDDYINNMLPLSGDASPEKSTDTVKKNANYFFVENEFIAGAYLSGHFIFPELSYSILTQSPEITTPPPRVC